MGLVLINTGEGKGKTTAALGTAIRAWGDGQRVLILQFIKGGMSYGEKKAIEFLGQGDHRIELRTMGDGFVFYHKKTTPSELEHKKQLADKGWQMVKEEVNSGHWDLIVLDEINYAIHFGLISEEDVIQLLKNRPENVNLILTGRYALPSVVQLADTVTDMKLIKHAFQKGIKAVRGIEY